MELKEKISLLWIVVMINMAFADILGFMLDWSTGATPEVVATEEMMLMAAIFLEIPIAMIFLSRILKYAANRRANIIAGVLTIVFVVAGGSLVLHYVFFAAVEVACMLLIIWYVWKWPNPESV